MTIYPEGFHLLFGYEEHLEAAKDYIRRNGWTHDDVSLQIINCDPKEIRVISKREVHVRV